MNVGEPFSPYRVFIGIFIPDALVPFRGINAAEKICLARLFRYCGKDQKCWPSQEKLAEELGVDVRSVQTYIQHLQEEGFIRIEQRGLGRTNEYIMLCHPVFFEEEEVHIQTRKNLQVQTRGSTVDPDPKESSGPLHLLSEESHIEESHNDFLKILLRSHTNTKGTKKAGSLERRLLGEWLSEQSELQEHIQGAWLCWLADELWREKRWPTERFRHHFQKYLNQFLQSTPPSNPKKDDSAAAPSEDVRVQVATPDAPQLALAQKDAIAEWNRLVPQARTEINSEKAPLLRESEKDTAFWENFTILCDKVNQAIDLRGGSESLSYMDLYWMCKIDRAKGETKPNWKRFLFGNLRHMWAPQNPAMRKKEISGHEAIERTLANRRAARAQKAAEGA